jgi:hypothetical protein
MANRLPLPLGFANPQILFRQVPSSAMKQQRCDQSALKQDKNDTADNAPSVRFPQARFFTNSAV